MLVVLPPDLPDHQRAAIELLARRAAEWRESFEGRDFNKRRDAARMGRRRKMLTGGLSAAPKEDGSVFLPSTDDRE